MPLLVLITGKAEAAKLSKNTSKAVMVLTIVERYTAKTAYLSGKINTIQLPDVSTKACRLSPDVQTDGRVSVLTALGALCLKIIEGLSAHRAVVFGPHHPSGAPTS